MSEQEFFFINSWRIGATIAKQTQIELSKSTLIKLMQLVKSVPLLYSNMMETLNRINIYCKSRFSVFRVIISRQRKRIFLYWLIVCKEFYSLRQTSFSSKNNRQNIH